jgi:hypothetical protein
MHRDFMSHHPPTFSHAVDPLDADDWLKVIGKKLDITQCNDREKVLYASGRLEGAASDWWDAFTAAHPNADTITWQEFQANFHAHHIPSGIMKLKKKEFLSLTQGSMSVSEYRDRFTQLSRYAPEEVDTDEKRQERFLEGLIGPLNYQLQSHTFPNFQTLLNKAIGLESKKRNYLTTKENFKVSLAGTPVRTTLKVRSSALEIKAETIIKFNALDSKAREIIRVRTNKGVTLRPTRGLVEIHRIVKVALVTRRLETTHLSNPMAASSAVNWATMLTTAQGATSRHPKKTITREMTRTPPLVDLLRTRHHRTRAEEGSITSPQNQYLRMPT